MSTVDRKVFSDHSPTLRLNICKAMFVWPLHIKHTSSDSSGCSGCYVTPISPAINARDVTDSRLQDIYCGRLIHQTLCHVLLGEIAHFNSRNSAHRALFREHYFNMHSVFDRYNNVEDENGTNPFGYFNAFFPLTRMRDAVKVLLTGQSSIIASHSSSTRSRMIDKIDKLGSPAYLMQYTLDAMFKEYNEFVSEHDYEKLVESLRRLLPTTQVPNCLRNCSPKLLAIFLFQKSFPYCCAFLNGNHRHCRFLFQEMTLSRRERNDLIDESHIDGYIIPICTHSNSRPCNGDMVLYQVFSANEELKGNLMEKDFLSFSLRINEHSSKTVPNEPCHRFMMLMKNILDKVIIDSNIRNVHDSLLGLLQCTSSNIKNKNRGVTDNPVLVWVDNKEVLRQFVAKEFFPHNYDNVLTGYSKGITYYERFKTKRDVKTICHSLEKIDDMHLMVFLMVDFISNPHELLSILKVIKDGYKYDHLSSSIEHNIPHAEIWNSVKVYEAMNECAYFLIKMFQDFNAWENIADAPDDVKNICAGTSGTKSLHQFKIKRCCQQYAVFCVLSIAKYIGLYPHVDGLAWSLSSEQQKSGFYSRYNIFNWILYLLKLKSLIPVDAVIMNDEAQDATVGDTGSTGSSHTDQLSYVEDDSLIAASAKELEDSRPKDRQLPIHHFHNNVLLHFATLFSEQVATTETAVRRNSFPWTYQEFLDNECHTYFPKFFSLMCTQYKNESVMFFQPLIPVSIKYKKKRKKKKVDQGEESKQVAQGEESAHRDNQDMEDEDMSEENTVEGNTKPSNCSSNNPGRIVNDVNNNSSEATNVELITASSRPVSDQARYDNSGRWMDVQEKLRQHNHAILLNMQCHIDALKKYIASTAKWDDNNESNVPDYVWDALKGLECNQQALLGSYNV